MLMMQDFLKRVHACVHVHLMRVCFVMCGRDLLDWIELSFSVCLFLSLSFVFSQIQRESLLLRFSHTSHTYTRTLFFRSPLFSFTSSMSFSCSDWFFSSTLPLAPAHLFSHPACFSRIAMFGLCYVGVLAFGLCDFGSVQNGIVAYYIIILHSVLTVSDTEHIMQQQEFFKVVNRVKCYYLQVPLSNGSLLIGDFGIC